MAVAQGYGKIITSGPIFMYDTSDTFNSYKGEPTTNVFTHYGTEGQGSSADNAVNFSIQGTTGFIRLGYGQSFGDYKIKPGDVVYKYNLGANGCHFHGNSVSIPSGKYVTFTFDYYVSPGTTIENTLLANLENYGGSALGGNIFAPNNLTGVWQTVTATFGPTGGSGTQVMFLYPGGCGPRFGDTGYILYKNPQVEFLPYKTPFVQTTRTPTQSLIPLVGNSTLDLSNVSFNSNSQMIFDGTNDDLRVLVSDSKTNITMEGVFYVNLGTTGTYLNNGNDSGGYCIGIGQYFNNPDNQITALFGSVRWILTGAYYEYTGYHHIVMTLDETSTPSIYVNGKLIGTYPGTPPNNVTPGTGFSIGSQWGIRYSNTICPVSKFYNRVLSANEIKQNYEFYNARLGNELDTYYFTVSNLATRYTHSTGKGYTMPTTTPAYIIYKKPSEQIVGPYSYRELSYDFIGSPPRLTKYGTQTKYSGGKYFTDVTVRKKKKDGALSFEFPNGGTSQYGENFYKTIITPHIPK